MKSLFAIIRRYMFFALLLIFGLIFLNIGIFFFYGIRQEKVLTPRYGIQFYAEAFEKKEGRYALSEEGMKRLKASDLIFAMEINEQGQVIWSYQLPKSLNRTYSLSDIASMSRWYLDDYPVHVWNNSYGIFVTGKPKDSTWKLMIERPLSVIEKIPNYLLLFLGANLIGIFLVFLFTGWKLFSSLKPTAEGIEKLALSKRTSLPEKGITAELNQKINSVSTLLEKQKHHLASRDMARTNWISGVSHDIRTPLSMIMGYTDILKKEAGLSEEQKEKLDCIQNQSLHIKELIEDLNLTSRLEYEMQPLRPQPYCMGSLLREMISDFYNNGLADSYSIFLTISKEAERLSIVGDIPLLKRAFSNLIGNSIRHNPDGCDISICANQKGNCCCLTFEDSGIGISSEIIRLLDSFPENDNKKKDQQKPHVLGLLLVKQIVESHNGKINFIFVNQKVNRIEILLPLSL